ncbi:MAG: hypothetical protein NC200_01360 [Candidatus Gastranaerophilales bacterium]|nr:hypothetical protein [Candidatus Gastranaerophilales bacterium]
MIDFKDVLATYCTVGILAAPLFSLSAIFIIVGILTYKFLKRFIRNENILYKLKVLFYIILPTIIESFITVCLVSNMDCLYGELLLFYLLCVMPFIFLFFFIIPFCIMLFKERKPEYRIKDKSVFENKVLRKFMYVSSLIGYVAYISFFFVLLYFIAYILKII